MDHFLLHITITTQQLIIIFALCILNFVVSCQKVVNEERTMPDDNYIKT